MRVLTPNESPRLQMTVVTNNIIPYIAACFSIYKALLYALSHVILIRTSENDGKDAISFAQMRKPSSVVF